METASLAHFVSVERHPGRLRASERVRIDHGSVLKNVLVELLVDLPADIDVPVVASAPERIWLWSNLHLSDPSVLLGWCRPFRSVEQMNRHAALPPGMYKRTCRHQHELRPRGRLLQRLQQRVLGRRDEQIRRHRR